MNIKFRQKITEELIFSKFSEETIMGFYLNVPIKKGLFRSPLRSDKNPTCSLYRDRNNKLIFKDFATGQYLDCINVVMTLFNCSYHQALRIIANDFGIVKTESLIKTKGKIDLNPTKITDKEVSKIQVEIQDFTDKELKWWNKYGITKEILEVYKVYSCKSIFLNDNLIAQSTSFCPIFGYYGGKAKGLELWRCYFPKRTSYRFLGNYPSNKIQGYKQLPKEGKLLIITKSMKDSMCLHSLGIPACAPCSEVLFVSDVVLENFKKRFKYIVVLYDNDLTGISFMNKIKKKYPELIYTWIPRKYDAKDISDFYKKYNKKKTVTLIKEFLLWLKNSRKTLT